MADWKSLRRAYIDKNDVISLYGWVRTSPFDFYRSLFPAGFMQDAGDPCADGRPNAIALEICGARTGAGGRDYRDIRRHTVTDSLEQLDGIQQHSRDTNSFCFMSPMTYFGKARTAANARYLHALAVDLDGVGRDQCERVVHWCETGGLRVPANYIVNSGTGLHLYYVLDQPVPLLPKHVPGLQLLKRRITERVWTEDTSLHEHIQYQGIYQGFRMPGTSTKLNGDPGTRKRHRPYEVVAWKNPYVDTTALDQLVDWVPNVGKRGNQLEELRDVMATAGKTPLSRARELWPDWYDRRIVRGQDPGSYLVKRDLYDWWLRRIESERTIHHRYWCIFALASYANKCGVPQDELERDAFGLLDNFKGIDTPDNKFTEDDVLAALDAYEDGGADGRARRYTRAFLERKTAIEMPARKRNGRTREEQLRIARFIQDMDDPDGAWRGRPKGSRNRDYPKRDAIYDYVDEHPDATHSQIARVLGISRSTVIKWLRVREEEGRDGR